MTGKADPFDFGEGPVSSQRPRRKSGMSTTGIVALIVAGVVIVFCVVLFVLGSAAGWGSSGLDGLFEENLALIEEATVLLRGIKDEPSAKAALPRLEKIGDRAAELTRQAKALKLSEAEKQKVMDRHRDKLLAVADKLFVAENEARDRAPRQADRIHAVVAKLTHS
jgi:hypothetical protein